jgi:hypothetical protein
MHYRGFALTLKKENDWLVGDVNVSQLFDEFKNECITNCSDSNAADKDFLQLLVISSIMVIQKHCGYKDGPYQYITQATWQMMHREIIMASV